MEERKDNADPQSNVFGSLLTTFGSVEVGGRNFFKLMQNGECVLLYPGGVREVYTLFHPPVNLLPGNTFVDFLHVVCRSIAVHNHQNALDANAYP